MSALHPAEAEERRVTTGVAPSLAPVSHAQRRLWLLHHLQPQSSAYNVRKALRLDGPLDVPSLQAAFDDVVARHEIFRTTFSVVDGEPVQSIAPALALPLPVYDLGNVDESLRDAEAYRRVHAVASAPFDLANGPLVRVSLFRLGPQRHIVVIAMHHIVFDDGSVAAFNRELSACYAARRAGVVPELGELPLQYADFAVWQLETFAGDALETGLRYWREQLTGAPGRIELPTDFARPAMQRFRGSAASLLLPGDLADRIRALTRARGATLFMTLLAAFDVLLYKYTGQRDLVVGSPIANRTRTELEPMIGFFVNTLALRTQLAGDLSFADVLARVRESAVSAYEHQDVPFERVVEALQPERNLGSLPLVNVMFFVRSELGDPLELAGLHVRPYPLESSSARFDLTLRVSEVATGLECSLQYDTDLFERERIERMLGHFENVLRAVVEAPDAPLRTLTMLSEAEFRRAVVEWNATSTPYESERPLQRIFEARAAAAPHAVAVASNGDETTYAELNARANRLARQLQKAGIGRGCVVGICLEREPQMVVAALGILKAGAAYMPLDPAYPLERLRAMLAGAGARAVVTQRRFFGRFGRRRGLDLIDVDAPRATASHDLEAASGPDDAAYVMYTSGSTGRPKGAVVPHRAVARLVTGTDYVTFGASDVVAQVANFSFDAATFEIWGALLSGGRLEIAPHEVLLAAHDFERFLQQRRVSIMFLTAALFRSLAADAPAMFRSLECLIVGGETVDPASARAVMEAGPPGRLLDGYGPTECTTFACTHTIDEPPAGPIPIGRPIANTEAYVLDADLGPVPAGVPGQLYLGGPGLAKGYVNDEAATARAFVRHPFKPEPTARLYATGDVAQYAPDGTLAFLGRADRQVKIRGFRIEIDEVEGALRALPGIRAAAVCLRERAADKRLVAYVVDDVRPARTNAALRRQLGRVLPEYMLPSIVGVPSIPLTRNGKIDFEALAQAAGEARPEPVALDLAQYELVGLWHEMLGVRHVGPHDDFFDLGGHSLLTTRMLAAVERAFGRRVPLAAFLEEPTVAHLGALLQTTENDVPRAVVALRAGGHETPLHFFHGDLYGGGYYMRGLARFLARPLYVFSPHGLGGLPLLPTVERMALDALPLLKQNQPVGPYVLGGYCSGGLVAYELARILEARGEPVTSVLLLDSPGGNGRLAPLLAPLDAALRFLRLPQAPRVALIGAVAFVVHDVRRALLFVRRSRASALGDARRLFSAVFQRVFHARAASRSSLEDVWRDLTVRYVPGRYRGNVTLLLPEMDRAERSASQRGWRAVAPNLRVATVPGEHLTCITQHLDETALRLGEVLAAVDGGAP